MLNGFDPTQLVPVKDAALSRGFPTVQSLRQFAVRHNPVFPESRVFFTRGKVDLASLDRALAAEAEKYTP